MKLNMFIFFALTVGSLIFKAEIYWVIMSAIVCGILAGALLRKSTPIFDKKAAVTWSIIMSVATIIFIVLNVPVAVALSTWFVGICIGGFFGYTEVYE